MSNYEIILILLAGLLAAAFVVYLVAMLRSNYGPIQYIFMWTAYLLTRFLWGTKVVNPFPLGLDEGAVMVINHRSSIDPFFVQVLAGRPMHWMVAKEFCNHFLFGPPLRVCKVIPVNRGGIDTSATKLSIRYVRQGGIVGMFPEGRINMTEQFMLPVRPGSVLIALKGNVPIIPCYIEGAPYAGKPWTPFVMRANVRVYFGDPIDLSEYDGREHESGVVGEIMLRCVREIAKLAGQDDFEPQLAGRKWKPSQEELDADIAALRKRQAQDDPS